jgi:hypothetical protein
MSADPTENRGPNYFGASGSASPPAGFSAMETPQVASQQVNVASQLLARFLGEQGYHPVVLCGTAQAGKTTMLASLCAYLKTCGTASIEFGDWFDLGESAEAKEQLEEAQRFFKYSVGDFKEGIGPAGTQIHLPYIVPLIVTPTNTRGMPRGADNRIKPVKFAMMDMRGEFFKPNRVTPLHRPIHPDAQSLLRSFERGVTMLYLAPVTRIDGYGYGGAGQFEPHDNDDADIRFEENPDEALLNAIRGYESARPVRGMDRHLFMLTKWDIRTKGTEDPGFSAPTEREITEFLEEKFGSSWAAFRCLRASRDSKWFVQYCAGIIAGRQVIKQRGESLARVDRYSKVLWNWLYEGAKRVNGQSHEHVLFPDVVPKPRSWMETWIGGRSSR